MDAKGRIRTSFEGADWAELAPRIKEIGPEKVKQLIELYGEASPELLGFEKADPSEENTPESFLKRRNLDPELWEVVGVREWSMTTGSGETYYNTWYNAKPNEQQRAKKAEGFIERALERARKDSPTLINFPFINSRKRTQTLHYFPTDHHLGKVAYDRTGNEVWNLEKASTEYLQAPQDILNQIKNPELLDRIVFVVGSDFYHYDNLKGQTTKGTQLDYEKKWEICFERGIDLNIDTINFLRQLAPVKVMECRGNHDEQSTFAMFKALECAFHNTNDITFERSHMGRVYDWDGYNLIGYTHGNDIKDHDLGSVMAYENKHFYEAKEKEWLTGHIHKEKTSRKKLPVFVDGDKGVTIRIIRAMCGTDDWHGKHGYLSSNPGTEAFLRCNKRGLLNHIYRGMEHY